MGSMCGNKHRTQTFRSITQLESCVLYTIWGFEGLERGICGGTRESRSLFVAMSERPENGCGQVHSLGVDRIFRRDARDIEG